MFSIGRAFMRTYGTGRFKAIHTIYHPNPLIHSRRTTPDRRGWPPPPAAATMLWGTSVGIPGGRKERMPPSSRSSAPGAVPVQAA